MTDQASPPTGFSQVTYTSQFQGTTASALDFRVKSGANLINTGTSDSTNGATDIAGTSRPAGSGWDIGSWEFVSAFINRPGPRMGPTIPLGLAIGGAKLLERNPIIRRRELFLWVKK